MKQGIFKLPSLLQELIASYPSMLRRYEINEHEIVLVENSEQNNLTLQHEYEEAYSSLELVQNVYPLPQGLDRYNVVGEVNKWRKHKNIDSLFFFVTSLGKAKLEVSTLRRDKDLMTASTDQIKEFIATLSNNKNDTSATSNHQTLIEKNKSPEEGGQIIKEKDAYTI